MRQTKGACGYITFVPHVPPAVSFLAFGIVMLKMHMYSKNLLLTSCFQCKPCSPVTEKKNPIFDFSVAETGLWMGTTPSQREPEYDLDPYMFCDVQLWIF